MKLWYRKTKGYKYVVAERVTYAVPEMGTARAKHQAAHPLFELADGVLAVEPGYAWNGASGPTIDTKSSIKASLPHDVFYQMIRAGLLAPSYKPAADLVLARLMREYPAAWQWWANFRARYYLAGVRIGGWWSTRRREVEPQDQLFAV